jgi:hypothetical protein
MFFFPWELPVTIRTTNVNKAGIIRKMIFIVSPRSVMRRLMNLYQMDLIYQRRRAIGGEFFIVGAEDERRFPNGYL